MSQPLKQAIESGGDGLAISIVNWRSAELTISCLESIACVGDFVHPPLTYVVDNDSQDGSFERIVNAVMDRGWGSWVRVLAASRNGGFAYGNNLAIRTALSERPDLSFIHLLNPDTLVKPGAFRELLDFAARHPAAGVIGGRSEDLDGSPQCCAFRFPSLLGEFAAYLRLGVVDRLLEPWRIRLGILESPARVGWVSGAHMLIRRELFESVGLMDEGFFLYFEETDFILRAALAGWECWHVPSSRVVHLVGQTSGINKKGVRPRPLPSYWFDSRRRYFERHHGHMYSVATDVSVVIAYSIWRLRRLLQRKADPDPPGFLAGLFAHGSLSIRRKAPPSRAIRE